MVKVKVFYLLGNKEADRTNLHYSFRISYKCKRLNKFSSPFVIYYDDAFDKTHKPT